MPVIHFYITREVGTFLAGNLPNLAFAPIKPGTSGLPFPGFAIDSLDNGASVRNKPGRLVLKMPWPGMPLESHRWVGGVFYLGDIGIIDDDMFLGIGFETVAPGYAVAILDGKIPENLKIMSLVKLTPPAAYLAIDTIREKPTDFPIMRRVGEVRRRRTRR